MIDEPYGRKQPSIQREIPAPSPSIEIELRRLSCKNGQERKATPDTSEHTITPVQRITTHINFSSRTLDEAFAEGLNRKWEDISSRYEHIILSGENINLTVNGHIVIATRDDNGFTFTIDGQSQDSSFGRDFLERNNIDLSASLREELKQREQERSAMEGQDKSQSQQMQNVRNADMAYEQMELLRKQQKNYEAQMKGDRHIIQKMKEGEEIER